MIKIKHKEYEKLEMTLILRIGLVVNPLSVFSMMTIKSYSFIMVKPDERLVQLGPLRHWLGKLEFYEF